MLKVWNMKNFKNLLIGFSTLMALVFSFAAGALEDGQEFDRDPASTFTPVIKRAYPGSADEEELKVLPAVQDVPLKADARSIQKEVFKTLYNQELKDGADAVEE
jgi:hypothetical protein